MTTTIRTVGLDETIKAMQQYPDQLNQAVELTMEASMLTLWESVPPYPNQPSGANYTRTGTLGRTLGSGEAGGKTGGEPDIFETRALGAPGALEGRFGTNLEYAPYVIGDKDQAMHMGYWWQMKDIGERAAQKIERLWVDLGQKMKDFLERRA